MSETSPNASNSTDMQRRYSNRQTVNELFQVCAPHQRALLGVLAVSNRYGLDPAPILSSLGTELPKSYRKKTVELVQQLVQGDEADKALLKIPDLLPPIAVLALRMAREEGTLEAFYSAVLDRTPQEDSPVPSENENDFAKISRLAVRALTVAFLLSFILLKIIPEFSKMLQEFGVEPPRTLAILISICDALATYWYVGVLLLIVGLPLCIPAIRRYLRRWNPFIWRQPDFFPETSRRRALALAAQSGSSLSNIIQTMLECVSHRRTAKRLKRAQAKIEQGNGAWESLAAANIISRHEAEALSVSSTPQTQAWLLRWSASKNQLHQAARAAAGTRVFVTVVNIGIGLLVALAAVGVFMTLIAIMESLY